MIRILRMDTFPAGPGRALRSDLPHRFMFVTNEPDGDGVHYVFWFSGVGEENLTDSVTIPTHPVGSGTPSSDSFATNPRTFDVDAWLASHMPQEEIFTTDTDLMGTTDITANGEVRSYRYVPLVTGPDTTLHARGLDMLKELHFAKGKPCTIYSVRHGILGPFALAGISSPSGAAGRMDFNLSFQEYRPAKNVDAVIVPSIPRGEAQQPPTNGDWTLSGLSNTAQDAGPSTLKTLRGHEYGSTPDNIAGNREYDFLQQHVPEQNTLWESFLETPGVGTGLIEGL